MEPETSNIGSLDPLGLMSLPQGLLTLLVTCGGPLLPLRMADCQTAADLPQMIYRRPFWSQPPAISEGRYGPPTWNKPGFLCGCRSMNSCCGTGRKTNESEFPLIDSIALGACLKGNYLQ